MKAAERQRDELRERVRRARELSRLSNAEIAAAAGVDPGQASKICRGKFQTLSDSVVKICNILGVAPRFGPASSDDVPVTPRRADGWERLEGALLRIWDETPEGAERLVRVLDAVADMGRPPRRRRR